MGDSLKWVKSKRRREKKERKRERKLVKTMAKLRMAHASTHGARKPPGPKWLPEWQNFYLRKKCICIHLYLNGCPFEIITAWQNDCCATKCLPDHVTHWLPPCVMQWRNYIQCDIIHCRSAFAAKNKLRLSWGSTQAETVKLLFKAQLGLVCSLTESEKITQIEWSNKLYQKNSIYNYVRVFVWNKYCK